MRVNWLNRLLLPSHLEVRSPLVFLKDLLSERIILFWSWRSALLLEGHLAHRIVGLVLLNIPNVLMRFGWLHRKIEMVGLQILFNLVCPRGTLSRFCVYLWFGVLLRGFAYAAELISLLSNRNARYF